MRAGSVELIKRGASRYDFHDPYHIALSMSWKAFALAFVGCELASISSSRSSICKAGCIANARRARFGCLLFQPRDAGDRGVWNMAPATLYGHAVSAIEIVSGMAFTAIMTGLLFVRFRSRDRKSVRRQAVITSHNCTPTLMVRIANGACHADSCTVRLVCCCTRSARKVIPSLCARPRSDECDDPFIRIDLDLDAPDRRAESTRWLRRRAVHGVRCALFLTIEARDHALGAMSTTCAYTRLKRSCRHALRRSGHV